MLKPPDTVSIAFVNGMLSGVSSAAGGPARDAWLIEAGIAPDLLAEPAARITAQQYVALFTRLMDGRDDEALGFFARPLRRGSFALMARSTLGAATLAQSLRRLCRTFRVLQDDVALDCTRDAQGRVGLRITMIDPGAARHTFLHELLLRVLWRLIAWLHGGRLKPARFDFAFATPAHAAEYATVFPGTVAFAQTHSAVWFDAASLAVPVLRDEAALRAFLAHAPANVIIPERSHHTVGTRVRAHLQRSRPAWPDLPATASALHVSTSTLQRHLAAEGSSFQALKDQLRRDLAIVRLNTSATPLVVLAAELGFADSATFQRAFKGWTGSAPGAYRRASAQR